MAAPRKAWCQCCIAGGGPAGMMLGYLLARAGVDVIVLEKHADFFRDFRGDTIHPSTLEVMHELGLLTRSWSCRIRRCATLERAVRRAARAHRRLPHLPTRCKFIALMPQWDFLEFPRRAGAALSGLPAADGGRGDRPDRGGGRVVGVRARDADGDARDPRRPRRGRRRPPFDARASAAGLQRRDLGAPMDVLWFRLSRRPDDRGQPLGRFGAGRILVADRPRRLLAVRLRDPQGRARGAARARPRGLSRAHRAARARARDGSASSRDWDEVKLLTVRSTGWSRW